MFRFTFRQEQLAKLTPTELIETGYLSSLLEQHPHAKQKMFSHRFCIVRDFLEQIVSVVPIESLFYTIAISKDDEIKKRCIDLFESCQLDLPPSLLLLSGADNAIDSFSKTVSSSLFASPEDRYLHCLQLNSSKIVTIKDAQREYAKQSSRGANPRTVSDITDREMFYTKRLLFDNVEKPTTSETLEAFQQICPNHHDPYRAVVLYSLLDEAHSKARKCKQLNAINDIKLNIVYPITSQEKSPLHILISGRQKLSILSQQSIGQSSSSLTTDQQQKLSQLYNSKMLELVNNIRSKELKMCTHLLCAFMENQIKVPSVKSEFNTAKALSALVNAAAVGVWAMFSLSLGDMNAVIRSIPSGSLLVQVKEYIRGIFAEKTSTVDHNYAGKLQFLIQGMDKTVSCNTHYISYSLERQLIELCKKLNISDSTPLEVLIRDWDKLFKDDVLSLVVPTHRSLIACWMKWALMVHNLREELAKYTTVGVVGLVNSGKSLLVSTLFNIEVTYVCNYIPSMCV